MPRRVLFLGSELDAASWRFRVAQYLPHLRAHGIEAETADLYAPLVQRLRILFAARQYDTVFVHRVLLSAFEHLCLARAARRYVFDFDDAIMFRDSAASHFDSWQRRLALSRLLRGAAAVIAGNAYLADWARRRGVTATIIPTVVDLRQYPPGTTVGGAPTVGWIGTRSTLMYLRAIVPALRRLAAQRPAVRVHVVSDGRLEVPDLPLTNTPWSLADEAAHLRGFSVGLMPLPDDPWTRGKCAVKILQYFAAGLPVVCSPVGSNAELVEDGRSGYFAVGADEWVARLTELLDDAALRRRFGERGRAVVEERYSLDVTLPRLCEVLLSQP
jgi:glycosyltransferase involved in cell wall biosynthesis